MGVRGGGLISSVLKVRKMVKNNLFFLVETKKKTLVSVEKEKDVFVVYHDGKRVACHNHVDNAVKTAQEVLSFYNN